MRALVASIVCAAVVASEGRAAGQSIAVGVDQSAGYSTEGSSVAAVQIRALGDITREVHFTVETNAAVRRGEGDAFDAAYPYSGHLQLMEAFGEATLSPAGGVLAIRAGRYRTPFGIHTAADHAYAGFLRAPLIRYDDYFALSNHFMEQGVDLLVSRSRLSVEASLGAPGDAGDAIRPRALDVVTRAQVVFGPVIAGASLIDTSPYQSPLFAKGRARFYGFDGRWMRAGAQLRAEWIWGRPFDRTSTAGGYLDFSLHRPELEAVTFVMRAERLDYQALGPYSLYAERYTAGARIRIANELSLQLNLLHQTRALSTHHPVAFDAAVTYSLQTRAWTKTPP